MNLKQKQKEKKTVEPANSRWQATLNWNHKVKVVVYHWHQEMSLLKNIFTLLHSWFAFRFDGVYALHRNSSTMHTVKIMLAASRLDKIFYALLSYSGILNQKVMQMHKKNSVEILFNLSSVSAFLVKFTL